MEAEKIARAAANAALEKKAEEIRILDVRSLSSVADFFVVCSGTTDTHVRAIYDGVASTLREQSVRARHVEGNSLGRWILLDYIDVIVHIFLPELRTFYSLERLWGDAKTETISDENSSN